MLDDAAIGAAALDLGKVQTGLLRADVKTGLIYVDVPEDEITLEFVRDAVEVVLDRQTASNRTSNRQRPVVRRALGPQIVGQVVIVAVAVALAIGFVLLAGIADGVHQREADDTDVVHVHPEGVLRDDQTAGGIGVTAQRERDR